MLIPADSRWSYMEFTVLISQLFHWILIFYNKYLREKNFAWNLIPNSRWGKGLLLLKTLALTSAPLKKALTLTSSSTGLPIPPDTPALQPAACSRLRAFALAIPSGQELCSLRYGHESLTSVRSLIKCFLLREMLSDHPCEKLHPSLYPILFFSPKTFITTRHASHIYLFLSLFFIFSLQYQLQQNRIFVPFLPPTAVALGSGTRKVLDKYW